MDRLPKVRGADARITGPNDGSTDRLVADRHAQHGLDAAGVHGEVTARPQRVAKAAPGGGRMMFGRQSQSFERLHPEASLQCAPVNGECVRVRRVGERKFQALGAGGAAVQFG
jgi:hypothetical protein